MAQNIMTLNDIKVLLGPTCPICRGSGYDPKYQDYRVCGRCYGTGCASPENVLTVLEILQNESYNLNKSQ